MTSLEQFNPNDQKYKTVDDLPEDEKKNFIADGEGFSRDTVAKEDLDAKFEADMVSALKGKGITSLDVLQSKALRINSREEDRNEAIEWIKHDGLYAFRNISEDLRADREVVLFAVKKNGHALEDASEDLRADREIVLEAVRQAGYAIKYASKELQADREIVFEALKNDSSAISYVSKEFWSDREIMLEVVKRVGHLLSYASKELQADHEIVLEAVKQDERALKYASEDIQKQIEKILKYV